MWRIVLQDRLVQPARIDDKLGSPAPQLFERLVVEVEELRERAFELDLSLDSVERGPVLKSLLKDLAVADLHAVMPVALRRIGFPTRNPFAGRDYLGRKIIRLSSQPAVW